MKVPGRQGGSSNPDLTRVDLHLHSRFSRESDLWILRQFGVGESNTDPETVYATCKDRGMDYVTLTDHNTIEGGLRLMDREDFFLSEEVTTYFPGEDVKLHLLALGITEDQHCEMQQLRPDLYQLVSYLNREHILYVLSHPLTRLGGELTPGHIERLMLLFPVWEVQNGSTLERENSMSRRLAETCTPGLLSILAEKHQLEPVTRDRISFTAGSDDHAGFDLASAWTATAPTADAGEFLREVRAGRTQPGGSHGSTLKLAHTMLGLLAQGAETLEKEGSLGRGGLSGWSFPGLGSVGNGARKWVNLISLAVGANGGGALKTVLRDAGLRKALLPMLSAAGGQPAGDVFHERLFALVGAAWAAGVRSSLEGLSGLSLSNLVDGFDKIGHMVALQGLLLPHCLAANYHSRQRHFIARLEKEMFSETAGVRQPRVGMFTDTFDEVNGVTSILKRLAEHCQTHDRPLEIICAGSGRGQDKVVRFPAVTRLNLPEYGQLDLTVPPILDVVKFCEERQYEVIHAATPGPMGLMAFLVSRVLQLPLVSSFHTDVPRCIGQLTDDKLNEEAAWTVTRWFYRRSDLIFAPSAATSRDLAEHGLKQRRMAVLYHGVDSDRFSPAFRSDRWRRRLGGAGKKLLLFVGRLSREKDLDFLAQCYFELRRTRDDIHLALVGDGPMRSELEAALGGQATFTGWLSGADLSAAFASADLFVFPSRVDTSGQVILEAQASGLPAVVCEEGGACENLEPGVSGLTAPSRDLAAFTRQIGALLDDGAARADMAAAARRSAESRSWGKVFANLFDTYAELVNWWKPLAAERPSREGSARHARRSAGRDDAGREFFAELGGPAVRL